MLNSLPAIKVVRSLDGESGERILDREDEADLVILSFGDLDTDTARHLALTARERQAKLLLLLDGYREEMLDTLAAIPSSGFLLQDELTTEALRTTIASLAHGDLPMPAPMARGLLTRVGSAPRREPAGAALTPRERDVLELLVEGLSNKQIARCLSISANGVKRLVSCVLAKLNCPNRTHAVAVALTLGILD
jgi:DNA-binding NarL/FixJ family response regulator